MQTRLPRGHACRPERSDGRADLHVHSRYSDAGQSPEAIVRAAAGRLDVVAITDHDEIAGGVRARDFAREHPELGVDVVVGEEISTLNGHLLGLYLSERVPPGLDLPAAVVLLASAPRARTLRAGRVPGVMGVLPGGRFVPS